MCEVEMAQPSGLTGGGSWCRVTCLPGPSSARLPPRSQVLEKLAPGCGEGKFSQPTAPIVITEMEKGSAPFFCMSPPAQEQD